VGGTQAKWISGLALTGLLMPIGILTEVYLGFPPYLVLLGATAIVIAAAWLGLAVMRLRIGPGVELEEHPLRT
jgi:hypothetical protein